MNFVDVILCFLMWYGTGLLFTSQYLYKIVNDKNDVHVFCKFTMTISILGPLGGLFAWYMQRIVIKSGFIPR